jgi:hypothetical protein
VKEETIRKKTRQGLAALGAIVALVVVLSLGSGAAGDSLQALIVGLILLGLWL